jgi:hypothetical protein
MKQTTTSTRNRKKATVAFAIILSSCVRNPSPLPTPPEEDRTIKFPRFHESAVVQVHAQQEPYEIDGALLKALMIAAYDFIPPSTQEQPCWARQEAYRYQAMRQGDIFFVWIDEDLAYCGRKYPSLDSGAAYAISTDGRILRRLIGSQLGELLELDTSGEGIPVPDAEVGNSQVNDGPSSYLPLSWQDAGPLSSPPTHPFPSPDGGAPSRDGGSPMPDGGSPSGLRDSGAQPIE